MRRKEASIAASDIAIVQKGGLETAVCRGAGGIGSGSLHMDVCPAGCGARTVVRARSMMMSAAPAKGGTPRASLLPKSSSVTAVTTRSHETGSRKYFLVQRTC